MSNRASGGTGGLDPLVITRLRADRQWDTAIALLLDAPPSAAILEELRQVVIDKAVELAGDHDATRVSSCLDIYKNQLRRFLDQRKVKDKANPIVPSKMR